MLRVACYVIAAVVFLSIQAEGAVSRGRLKTTTTIDSAGNTVTRRYCLYGQNEYDIGAKWDVGFPNCANCSCSSSGWTCLGYEINGGSGPAPPSGCIQAPNTCEVKFVQESDPSQACGASA